MPQHKSCEKRLKQDVKRTERNRADRGNLRTAVRAFRELELGKRPAEYSQLQSLLDRAVKKGTFRRTGRALKSRLAPAADP
jgi:ribosomal protein S20